MFNLEILNNVDWSMFIYFVVLNLIYVIMNTISSILCIKGSKGVSSIASAVCYGFYTIVLKTIVGCDTFTTVAGTIISNIIGRYLGMWLSPLFIGRPIVSYKFTISTDKIVTNRIIQQTLDEYLISYHIASAHDNKRIYNKYSIYPKNKKEDQLIIDLLKYNNIQSQHKEEY